jgi:hypothetical protein
MAKKTIRAAGTLVAILFLAIAATFQSTQASEVVTAFSDDFDGTTIDSAKWIVEENANMSGNPAYGGKVQIADGSIILSSEGSAFPCVTAAANPFPASGDFAVVFNFTYTKISDWGDGLWISKGEFISNRTNSPSNIILQLWANNLDYDQSAIFVNLLGKQVYRTIIYGWEPSANTQNFRLQYSGSTYTLFIDGIEIYSAESQLRPDAIGFGHPLAYYIPFTPAHVGNVVGGWTTFKIDYIKVLPQTSISVYTSVSSTALGFSIELNGTLTTKEGQPLSGKNIVFSFQTPGVFAWNYFTSAPTDSQGAYAATWLPTATSSYVVKAEWRGDDTYSGASDAKNISVVRSANDSLLFVESNSTLSSLSLNATANEVSFTVSGPTGTTGYVRFLVSKTLIANLSEFKLYMDGDETKFTATSTDTLQVLYFEYVHSSHQITIQLPTATPPSSRSSSPSVSPTASSNPTQTPTLEPSPNPNLTQEHSASTIIIVGLVIAAVVGGLLVCFAKRRGEK